MASTPLLGLALPTNGTTNWGTLVNTSITALLDSAVAGTTTISSATTPYVLTATLDAANEARQAIILCTGSRAAIQTIVAPYQSKTYVVINATTGGFGVQIVGVGPTTGVTIPNGKAYMVAWNGSDFVITGITSIDLATQVTGILPTANGGTNLGGATPFTANGVVYASSASALATGSVLTFNGAILGVNGVNVGRGTGAISSNTAIGSSALNSNTTGSSNTAIGSSALRDNTTGDGNTATGVNALISNTTGQGNTATGQNGLFSNTTGTGNTAVGQNGLFSNTTGYRNTAIGIEAIQNNTTGYHNTAVGGAALTANTTGDSSTAVGHGALSSNTIGVQNTAVGRSALLSNTTGQENTAVGSSALFSNTTGSSNIAVGPSALYSNTTGDTNTAVGYAALTLNLTGDINTAVGPYALFINTAGSNNTAIGNSALGSNTTGSGNTAINPINSTGGYAPVFDPVTQDNRFCMGSTAVTNAYIQVAWTVVSDARDKTNFAPVPHGLAFINQLKPTQYQFAVSRTDPTPHGPVRYGFKAQDILALEGNNPVIIDAENPEKLRYQGESLVPVLVKAIQELTARLEALEAK